ncbi:hypothetical protein RI367_008646 [Sorochytrium milnesiophthora]
MSRPTISSIFETLSQGPALVPAPPPVTPSRVRLPADIIPLVQPLVWAAPSRSQSFLPADEQEAAMLQEPVLQALLHLHPAEYRVLLEFASKPIWLQLTLIRHEQMEAARWRTAVDARLTEAMTPAQTGDGERAFELPIAVQDAINTHVRRWCVSHVAGQFQGLTWNTLFTGHAAEAMRLMWTDPHSQAAVLKHARTTRKVLRDGLKRKVFQFDTDKVPARALEQEHEQWVRFLTPAASLTSNEEKRKAALQGEPSYARKQFWECTERWCQEIWALRATGQALLFDQTLLALVQEDKERAQSLILRSDLPAPREPSSSFFPN